MKSVKQNIILQSIDRHRITLIESKQPLSTSKQRRPRLALDGSNELNRPSEASATDVARSCV